MVRPSVVLAVLAAAAVAVPALAATPKAGTFTSPGESGAGFTVKAGKIVKGAIVPSTFKCKVAAVLPASVAIKAGKARYSGPLKGSSARVVATFTFTTPTTAKVTATITKGTCHDHGSVTAKLMTAPTAPATPGAMLPGTG